MLASVAAGQHLTQLYGPAVRCKLNLLSGSELVLLFCIRPLCGADRSWPSWISARVRSHSQIGLRRPVGSPDHGRDGETVLHLLKSNSQTSAGVSFYQATQGSTEAIPSEPPSLARLTRRAAVAERDGGRHPFGEPERAHQAAPALTRASYVRSCASTLHAMRASLLARAVANTLWCSR